MSMTEDTKATLNDREDAGGRMYVAESSASPAATEYFDPMNSISNDDRNHVDDTNVDDTNVDQNNNNNYNYNDNSINNNNNNNNQEEDNNEENSHINIQEPTPKYEKVEPSPHPSARLPSPYPHAQPGGSMFVEDEKVSRHSTTSRRSNGSRHVENANSNSRTPDYDSNEHARSATTNRSFASGDDVVLGTGAKAGVTRSGTWANGGGTYGRGANVGRHASLAERASMAAEKLPAEKEAALTKAEKKDAKRLSKIIKAEGKAENKQLKSALKELASLQNAQKKASAAESAAATAQIKAAKEEQKASSAYLEAKTRMEQARVHLMACEERLQLSRENAEKTTGLLRRQAEEVDAMRERKATDDRERELKLSNLRAGKM